jgi:hypothetical protein
MAACRCWSCTSGHRKRRLRAPHSPVKRYGTSSLCPTSQPLAVRLTAFAHVAAQNVFCGNQHLYVLTSSKKIFARVAYRTNGVPSVGHSDIRAGRGSSKN